MAGTYRVRIMNDIENRGGLKVVDVIDSTGKHHEMMLFPSQLQQPVEEVIKKDNFYAISELDVPQEGILRFNNKRKGQLLSTTKIFSLKTPLKIPADAVHQFYHSSTVTIPEVKNSDVGRRVTIEGSLKELRPWQLTKTGNEWRPIRIYEEKTNEYITVKMWNKKIDIFEPSHLGQDVTIENLKVSEFKLVKDLNSTQETKILLKNMDTAQAGSSIEEIVATVFASNEVGDNIEILTDEGVYIITKKMVEDTKITIEEDAIYELKVKDKIIIEMTKETSG